MTGIYYTDLVDVLRAAGCQVQESATTNGWQRRARSSGGFPSAPLGVQWHHTASQTSPANDLSFMINGSSDSPIGNVLLDRNGVYWPIAAGAANTAGKGGPLTLSRGTVPADSGNTRTFAIEAANNGVGEAWPQVQIDAYFRGSNALNARFGNLPTDIFSHALGTGNGYTNRKIDPSTAAGVQGPWKPRSTNSSGTWNLDDMRAEATRRAAAVQPVPPPGGNMAAAAVVVGDDQLVRYFVRGGDSQLYQMWWDTEARAWSDWQCLGGEITGDPAATATPGSPRIDVAAQGGDGGLWRNVWDGSNWLGWEAVAAWPG